MYSPCAYKQSEVQSEGDTRGCGMYHIYPDESVDLSQLRICTEKILPSDEKHINSLKMNSISIQHYEKLRAAFLKGKMWTNGSVITIGFMEQPPNNILIRKYPLMLIDKNGNIVTHDPLQIEIINSYSNFNHSNIIGMIKRIVLERIQPNVNLQFKFVENPRNANIRIGFDTRSGAWSYLGTDSLGISSYYNTMNLGWFDVPTVIHEFGHVLGMVHEHQSPFGKPIQWNLRVLYKWASETQNWDVEETNQQIVNKYSVTQLNGSEFDPKSIMLYFFENYLTIDNSGTSMNTRLSPYDVVYMNYIYKGSKISPEEFYKNTYGESIPLSTYPIGMLPLVQTYPPTTYPPTTYPPTTYKPTTYPPTTYKPTTYPPTTYPPTTYPPTTYKPTTEQPKIPITIRPEVLVNTGDNPTQETVQKINYNYLWLLLLVPLLILLITIV
jgi:hypothetical protein